MRKLRRRLYLLLEDTESGPAARVIQVLLVALIALNVVAMMADSVHDIAVQWDAPLRQFELVSVGSSRWSTFCACGSPRARGLRAPAVGRLRYLVSPLAILDLLAILPVFMPCW